MVKFSLVLAVIGAILPASVMAEGECTKYSQYCGFLLIDGKGYSERKVACAADKYVCNAGDKKFVRNSLFLCAHNGKFTGGNLEFLKHCEKGCKDAGHGKNDYCL